MILFIVGFTIADEIISITKINKDISLSSEDKTTLSSMDIINPQAVDLIKKGDNCYFYIRESKTEEIEYEDMVYDEEYEEEITIVLKRNITTRVIDSREGFNCYGMSDAEIETKIQEVTKLRLEEIAIVKRERDSRVINKINKEIDFSLIEK